VDIDLWRDERRLAEVVETCFGACGAGIPLRRSMVGMDQSTGPKKICQGHANTGAHATCGHDAHPNAMKLSWNAA